MKKKEGYVSNKSPFKRQMFDLSQMKFQAYQAFCNQCQAILNWYTDLGSQTQTSELSKVLISGVTFHHCWLLQSHKSNVLSYSECKIAKILWGFAPELHWGGLTATPLPRLPRLAILMPKPDWSNIHAACHDYSDIFPQ